MTVKKNLDSPLPQEDLDFADDISLLSNQIEQAQELLIRVERSCMKVGLGLNAKKTKFLAYNIEGNLSLRTDNGDDLERQDDFKYLGSWVDSTENDVRIRKAQAWKSLNGMQKIWNSKMSRNLKIRLFVATIESILLYGCESWTLTEAQERALDGTYTRMLRKAQNIHWSSHITNKELYGTLPAVSNKISSRRLQLAGHCQRHPELSASKLVLWEPTHGSRSQGRPRQDFIGTLKRDTGATNTKELKDLMDDRGLWRSRVVARLRATE